MRQGGRFGFRLPFALSVLWLWRRFRCGRDDRRLLDEAECDVQLGIGERVAQFSVPRTVLIDPERHLQADVQRSGAFVGGRDLMYQLGVKLSALGKWRKYQRGG